MPMPVTPAPISARTILLLTAKALALISPLPVTVSVPAVSNVQVKPSPQVPVCTSSAAKAAIGSSVSSRHSTSAALRSFFFMPFLLLLSIIATFSIPEAAPSRKKIFAPQVRKTTKNRRPVQGRRFGVGFDLRGDLAEAL